MRQWVDREHMRGGCVGLTLAPDGEGTAWSGTMLASGSLDVTKNAPSTVQDRWIEMFGLGHKNSAVNKMQHTCFFLNTINTGHRVP